MILAGGKSQRAGFPKALRKFKGNLWLDHQAFQLRNLGIRHLFVGLANKADFILAQLKLYQDPSIFLPLTATFCHSTNRQSPFYTLQKCLSVVAGHSFCAQKTAGTFVSPIDCPVPQAPFFDLMQRALLEKSGCLVLKPSYKGQTGHPIFLHKKFFAPLLVPDIPMDNRRLDKQIQHLPRNQVAIIPTKESSILQNLNTKIPLGRFPQKF